MPRTKQIDRTFRFDPGVNQLLEDTARQTKLSPGDIIKYGIAAISKAGENRRAGRYLGFVSDPTTLETMMFIPGITDQPAREKPGPKPGSRRKAKPAPKAETAQDAANDLSEPAPVKPAKTKATRTSKAKDQRGRGHSPEDDQKRLLTAEIKRLGGRPPRFFSGLDKFKEVLEELRAKPEESTQAEAEETTETTQADAPTEGKDDLEERKEMLRKLDQPTDLSGADKKAKDRLSDLRGDDWDKVEAEQDAELGKEEEDDG